MADKGKILIIDDEEPIREFLRLFFEDRDFAVEAALDGVDALEKAKKQEYDLIICDVMMPRMHGHVFLKKLREFRPKQKAIVMSGISEETLMAKIKEGCWWYLTKPFKLSDLEACVERCFAVD